MRVRTQPWSKVRRRRRARPSAISDHDPIRAAEQAYARNLFVGTVLRQLQRGTLNGLEDAELAQEWAAEFQCDRCDADEPPILGDHIRHHLRRWLVAHGDPVRDPAPAAPVRRNVRIVAELLGRPRGGRRRRPRPPEPGAGDFAAMARRTRATGTSPSFADLVPMLAGETGVKRDAVRAVGFSP